jgi:hypothetical protein
MPVQPETPRCSSPTNSGQSYIPNDIPKLRNMNAAATIPSHLILSEQAHDHLETHLRMMGLDKHRFQQTAQDQSLFNFGFLHGYLH